MGLTVGIDIGGTKIAAGVVDGSGQVLARHRVATTERDAESVERTVADLVLRLRADYEIEAVGIGAAEGALQLKPQTLRIDLEALRQIRLQRFGDGQDAGSPRGRGRHGKGCRRQGHSGKIVHQGNLKRARRVSPARRSLSPAGT